MNGNNYFLGFQVTTLSSSTITASTTTASTTTTTTTTTASTVTNNNNNKNKKTGARGSRPRSQGHTPRRRGRAGLARRARPARAGNPPEAGAQVRPQGEKAEPRVQGESRGGTPEGAEDEASTTVSRGGCGSGCGGCGGWGGGGSGGLEGAWTWSVRGGGARGAGRREGAYGFYVVYVWRGMSAEFWLYTFGIDKPFLVSCGEFDILKFTHRGVVWTVVYEFCMVYIAQETKRIWCGRLRVDRGSMSMRSSKFVESW